jgi:hypothetical protein
MKKPFEFFGLSKDFLLSSFITIVVLQLISHSGSLIYMVLKIILAFLMAVVGGGIIDAYRYFFMRDKER